MAYQLKSTGIAANCTMCIAIDPDTSAIKDFASSAVTADMLIGANVTTGSQTWDGNTRSYWVPGSGTTDADFVKFGTNKPQFLMGASDTQRTIVFIGEIAGASARAFGGGSTEYLASANLSSGGSTHPTALVASNTINGAGAAVSSGQKRIFGFSLVRGTSWTSYTALDTDSSMTTNTGSLGSVNPNYSLTYVNRRNDSATHQQDKTHAILIFNTALSSSDWDSLRDDWFGTLLESAGGDVTPPTITGPGGATGATSSTSIAENTTAVFTFTADESVTWDLNGGADVAKFSINSSTGALSFLSAPDYENPTDADTNNTYVVGVRATDGASNATTQTCTVTVTDVAIPTAPTIGTVTDITASTATVPWTDNSSNETSFTVQVETPSGAANWANASTGASNPTAANATSLAITGLSPSTEYRARVKATNAEGDSSYSVGTAFTTDAASGSKLLLQLMNMH